MNYGKVGQRGQVVIPKKIREAKGILPGDTVKFLIKDNQILVEKLEPTDQLSLTDILTRIHFEEHLVENLRREWE